MRLHRLEITAFGPFGGTETIDFDALSDAGLFLIHGQTGAGKTSVLDAVCFALYGQVPGARSKAGGLRSDHAAPNTAPQVELETTLRGRRFRFVRSPAWERPKLRGAGTTQQHARVLVEELVNGRWEGLSIGKDEAGHLVERLLGMDAKQFCQVALLPQGEFAAFLRAGAEERRKVLERLFATEVYARVENWLTVHKRELGTEAARLRDAAESEADRIAEVAGTERPGDLASEPVEGLIPWAAELSDRFTTELADAGKLADECARALARARTAAEEGGALADRQRRHAEALRRRDELAGRAAERADLAATLETAMRAERVMPLITVAAGRERRAGQARDRAAGARAAVGALVPRSAPDDVLDKAEQDRRDEIARLGGLREEAARERALTAEATRLADHAERLRAAEAALAGRLETLPAQVEETRTELEAARVRVAGRPAAQAAVQEAVRRVETARRRDTVTTDLTRAEETRRAAVDRAQELLDDVQRIRQARLEGMAAELAARLTPGEPCPVCGAGEHPAPATPHDDAPTVEDERRAQAVHDRAQSAREDATAKVAELRAELDGLLEITQEPVKALAAALSDAQDALDALDADAALAEDLRRRLGEQEEELTRARREREDALRELTTASARHEELTAETERLRGRLDRARGDDPTLEARIDRLAGEAEALRTAVEAARQAATADGVLADARTAAGTAAEQAGFAGTEEARRAALDEAARDDLDRRIRDFDAQEETVRTVLSDPELTAAAALEPPDLDALRAAAGLAQQADQDAAAALDRARRRCDRLTALTDRLAEAVAEWRPVAERHAVARRLAEIASGQHPDNRDRMRLSAYVLAARLEQVVAAANERLARMSSSRYALEHTTDKAAADSRRGATGGLGLRVVDSWTGRFRDPATLSGGESFIASLALALGLADVVTAESAAGAEIGTLFVDEGFGTLDEDTLDEVMEVLDGLRDGGRAVGIVSHVAELRGRIPAQLRVRKERTGSTAAVTV